MRLARNVLEGVGGLEIFPIIGFIIFFAFFIGLIIWVVRIKSKDADEYSHMPLDEDIEESLSHNGNKS
jgi:cytochrome c oxidase cbb3-type subunit IV